MTTEEKVRELAEMVRILAWHTRQREASTGWSRCLGDIERRADIMACPEPAASKPEPFPVGTAVVADDGALRMETGVVVGVDSEGMMTHLVFDSALVNKRGHCGEDRCSEGGPVPGFASGHYWYSREHLRRR